MKYRSFFFFTTLIFNSFAYADILFIDLNFSEKEVATAMKAAKLRGEKLIVYPSVPDSDRKKLMKMRDEIIKVSKQKDKAVNGSKEKEDLITKKIELEDSRDKFTASKGYDYTPQSLSSLIEKYNKKNNGFSSMIISGHSGDLNFLGDAGTIGISKLKEMIAKYPDAFGEMRSLYLWGCYTTTKSKIKSWKETLPNAYVIAGFEASAPKQDKDIDLDYLHRMLVSEQKLSLNMSLKKAIEFFRSIPDIRSVTATFALGSCYISNKGGEMINKSFSCSEEVILKLKATKNKMLSYINATEKKFEDVPISTGQSDLREIYTLGRQLEHCEDARVLKSEELLVLIKLIFDRQIRKNLSLVYRDEMLLLNKKIKNMDSTLDPMPDFNDSTVTRSSLLKANRSLTQFILKNESKNTEDINFIRKMNNLIYNIVERHQCTGLIWIEDVGIKKLKESMMEECYSR